MFWIIAATLTVVLDLSLGFDGRKILTDLAWLCAWAVVLELLWWCRRR